MVPETEVQECFGRLLEVLNFLVGEMGMQQLDSHVQIEPHVLAQIDFCIGTLAQ